MSVAFDAVGPSSAGTSATATTLAWSHTCSGTDRVLFVGVAVGKSSSPPAISSVTFGAQAMTSLFKRTSNNGNAGYVQLFYLLNPAAGTDTITITRGAGSGTTMSAGSTSLTGASQTAADYTGTVVSAFGSSGDPTVTVTGTAADSMVVDAACNGNDFTSSNQTSRWIKNTNANTAAGNAAQSTAAGGGDITMSYNAVSDWCGIIAVEVKAAAAGPTTVNGTASASFTATATVTGKRTVMGAASASFTLSGTETGLRTVLAQAALLETFTATVTGVGSSGGTTVLGTASAALAFSAVMAGSRTVFGAAATSLALTAAAAGQRSVLGNASVSLTLTVTVNGTVISATVVTGTAQAALTFTATAASQRTALAAATADAGFSAGVHGVRTTFGSAQALLGFRVAPVEAEGTSHMHRIVFPTYERAIGTGDLLSRYTTQGTKSLVKVDGTWREVIMPSQELLRTVGEGNYYVGGYEYLLTDVEAGASGLPAEYLEEA